MRIGPKSWWLDGGQKKTLAEIDKFATANEMLDSATTAKFVIYDNVYVIRQPKQFPQPQRSLAKNQKAIPNHTQMGAHLLSSPEKGNSRMENGENSYHPSGCLFCLVEKSGHRAAVTDCSNGF